MDHAPDAVPRVDERIWRSPWHIEERLDETLGNFWLERVQRHVFDSYAGIALSKFPEDLRTYEHLLWESRSNVVIEIGIQFGASTLWFRDRLLTMARYGRISDPRVIGIDIDIAQAAARLSAADPDYAKTITLLRGDVRVPVLAKLVGKLVPTDARCFVVEDSAHTYDTTMAALRYFSDFVPPEGFFVVEDGCVDVEGMRLNSSWPRGVLPALAAWLETEQGAGFAVRRDLERYGITSHPRGFLQRKR
jgi:cephalosporin hydroxylase